MASQVVNVEVPDELVAIVGSPERTGDLMRRSLVIEFLRAGEISQGTAARLLGLSRYELLDLMAELRIPSAPRTIEDAQAELDTIEKFSRQ